MLTARHVAEALAAADAGTPFSEWVDEREAGLRIRVRGKRAVWLARFRDSSVTLGPASRWTPKQAREMAGHIRGMLKSGLDPRPWVDARLAGADVEEAAGVVLRREGRERQEWNMEVLMGTYVTEHVAKGRVVRAERRVPSLRTRQDVEATTLRARPFAKLAPLLARELDARALETYRNEMAKAHGGTASRKGLAYVKAALTWARRHHSAASGLGGCVSWWRDVASTHVESVNGRMPSLGDIGLTLALADATRRLPGRKIERAGSELKALALTLSVFTCQRRESVVRIRRSQIVTDDRSDDGWGVLYLPPEAMKGRKGHTLPMPPAAMEIVQRAIDVGGPNSEFLFPGSRVGKNGDTVHISGSSLNRLLARLAGKDETGKRGNAPDLLKLVGVRVEWSPHDARRTFATEIEDSTTRGDAVSAVLDHAQAGVRFAHASAIPDAAAITRIAYSQAQRLPLKRIALEPWADMVREAIEKARPIVTTAIAQQELEGRPKPR